MAVATACTACSGCVRMHERGGAGRPLLAGAWPVKVKVDDRVICTPLHSDPVHGTVLGLRFPVSPETGEPRPPWAYVQLDRPRIRMHFRVLDVEKETR